MLVNASTSWPVWKPVPMETVALAKVVLSRSLRVMALSITTGVEVPLLASVKTVVPPLTVTTGASFSALTVMVSDSVRVSIPLLAVPPESCTV